MSTGVRREVGKTSRTREYLGALTLLLGAGAVAACTAAFAFPLEQDLAVLGAAVTLAWLVDGSGERYLGAGVAALAIGGGMVLGERLSVPSYEELVVFGFLGLGLLLVSLINPAAIGGSAGLLIYVSITVLALVYLGSYNAGWELAAILAVWGLFELVRIARSAYPKTPAGGVATGKGGPGPL